MSKDYNNILSPQKNTSVDVNEYISLLKKTIKQHEITIRSQEMKIKKLSESRKESEISFIKDINIHFTEVYERFVDIQRQIKQTSHEALVDLNKKYRDMQQEKIKFIDPLLKLASTSHLRDLRQKVSHFFKPKLGELNLYPPQKMVIPKNYHKLKAISNLPSMSIVTPSYNHGEFLERTIKSILEQKYPRLEYIVQDGQSTDETVAILEYYASSFKHWESIKDNGQSHAINLGFKHTTGEIMAYLNSDDLLLPGALHYIGHYFSTHPDIDVVYGHRVLIDEDDYEIGRWVLPPHDNEVLSWSDYIPQETLFWRRSLWDKIGGYIDESFRFAMDWDLILRFREIGAKFARLPRFLGAFRIHSSQKTSSQIQESGIQEMQRLRERCHGRIVTPEEIAEKTRSYLIQHLLYHRLYRAKLLNY